MRISKITIDNGRVRGFTLIELMVTLAIITILATASVPQIQMWAARNRGKAAVSNIISDFAKAKAIAEYSMEGSDPSDVSIYKNYINTRPITGMMFRKTSYTIIQRPATNDDNVTWNDENSSDHSNLRRVELPFNVSIEYLNSGATNDGAGSSPTLTFTSDGRVKQSNGFLVPLGAGSGNLNCGAIPSTLNGRRIFNAVLKSNVSGEKNLWYRIEIDSNGEYFVCMEPVPSGDPTFGDGSEVLAI